MKTRFLAGQFCFFSLVTSSYIDIQKHASGFQTCDPMHPLHTGIHEEIRIGAPVESEVLDYNQRQGVATARDPAALPWTSGWWGPRYIPMYASHPVSEQFAMYPTPHHSAVKLFEWERL